MDSKLQILTRNAIIAALYVVLTVITYPISFLSIQFRLSEILVLLCFFRRDYIIGLTLGCLLSNLLSPMFPFDLLYGTLATLLTCIIVSFVRQLWLGAIIPVAINSFVIGFELYLITEANFWMASLYVAIGEFVVLLVGYIIVMLLKKKNKFFDLIKANRNVEFKC